MNKHIEIRTTDGETIEAVDRGSAGLSGDGEAHAEELARDRGITVSQLAREALERELAT